MLSSPTSSSSSGMVTPGHTTLHLIPARPFSLAIDFMKLLIAAFTPP